jgi:membrane-bound lytic murein transglycosylase B
MRFSSFLGASFSTVLNRVAFGTLFILCGLISSSNASQQTDLSDWLIELRKDAIARGISEATFDDALSDFSPIERIIELDRNQPEFTQTLDDYLAKRVTNTKIAKARELLEEHKVILAQISEYYNVQPRFIVTFWGLETNFGSYLGKYDVPQALATLAYDGRRGAFFRKELFNALQILDEGHIARADMKGGWAGEVGQAQFLPSSFLNYAQDWDKDGRKDVWANEQDVFASIAFYLKSAGWRDDITWGRQIILPDGQDFSSLVKNKKRKTLREWEAMGVRNPDGSLLPERNLTARIVTSSTSDLVFLAYSNFDSILRWNRSIYYAASVGRLSDALR